MNQYELLKLLPKYQERYLVAPIIKWGRQWCKATRNKQPIRDSNGKIRVEFSDKVNKGRSLTKENLINHFIQSEPFFGKAWDHQAKKNVDALWGSYGWGLKFHDNSVKSLLLDADNEYLVGLLDNYVLPWLDDKEIEYLWLHSGTETDPRAHLIIPTEHMDIKYTNTFLNQIREDSNKKVKEWFDEQYPYGSREDMLVRGPLGWHLKQSKRFGLTYKGEYRGDVIGGLEAFIEAQPMSLDKLLSTLKQSPKERRTTPSNEVIVYEDDYRLIAPFPEAPAFPKKITEKCPAYNKLLKEVRDNKRLESPGQYHHDSGLALSWLCEAQDKLNPEDSRGRQFFNHLLDTYRDRDAKAHNWDYYWGKTGNNFLTPGCNWLDKVFGDCEGCPYRGKIQNPCQLWDTKELIKEKVADIKLGSLEDIRATEFPEIEARVLKAINNNEILDLSIECIQGAGKSRFADRLAAKLALEGKKVCIAAGSGTVAMEHKEEVEANGAKAFVLFSFDSIFEHLSGGITCPSSTDIKWARALGMPSSYYKKKYCKECPLYDQCNYPKQYTIVQKDKYPVVIIQHAHFACEETIRQLFKKKFDVLIIDEDFMSSLLTQIKPTKIEIGALFKWRHVFPWIKPLLRWVLQGGCPTEEIKPLKGHLQSLHNYFTAKDIPWRLGDLLRLYKDKEYMDKVIGVMKFVPLPNCDIRLILNATATIEDLQIVLNNMDIERLGGTMICDPTLYHPDNRNFQVIDGRASKAELLKKEKLWEYLEWIGDKMMSDYKDLTALITVFIEDKDKSKLEQDVWEWMLRNYPKVAPRIAINHMAVGTNAFAKYNVQFILAAPYLSPKQLRMEVYKLKFIQNYWRKLEGSAPIANHWPGNLPDNVGGRINSYPCQVAHRDGIYKYPQFSYIVPNSESLEGIVRRRMVGKASQAARIRQSPGKRTDIWFIDNSPMLGFLIDEVYQEYQLLAPLRE